MNNDPKFLIKYASRSRPNNFFRGLDNLVENLFTTNYEILVSADIDDYSMTNEEVKNRIAQYEKVRVVYGTSKSKTEAINADIWMVDEWDILINHSDDILWLQKSFDSIIVEDANKYFPNGYFFLHYPESYSKERQATVSIMDRKYYGRTGWIYNPIYASVYCDNEALEVAKRLGRHKFINKQLFEHYHPAIGNAPTDDLYKRNENKELYKKDAETYFKRLANNFGL